jgi:hypothetical protein
MPHDEQFIVRTKPISGSVAVPQFGQLKSIAIDVAQTGLTCDTEPRCRRGHT